MTKKPRLVLIEWVDSSQPTPQWQWLSDVGEIPAVCCRTVGFLIHDTRAVKMVAQNIGDLESDGPQVSGIICIPTQAVTRMKTLKA